MIMIWLWYDYDMIMIWFSSPQRNTARQLMLSMEPETHEMIRKNGWEMTDKFGIYTMAMIWPWYTSLLFGDIWVPLKYFAWDQNWGN